MLCRYMDDLLFLNQGSLHSLYTNNSVHRNMFFPKRQMNASIVLMSIKKSPARVY